MKYCYYILSSIFFCLSGYSQVSQADLEKMSKMTPQQQEVYKQQLLKKYSAQAKQLSKQTGIPINEELLPDAELQLPTKDEKKLATIPATTFSNSELLAYTVLIERKLMDIASAADKQWLDTVIQNKKAFQQHNAAAGEWYKNEPVKALLLQIKTAKQNQNDVLAWNNLGAMLNMAGLPHKAVPVLKYCLAKMPNHNVVLNNLGQCYVKMGDVIKGKQYLQKSLAAAPFNPDANHTMGMISMYEKNMSAARSYFEKALQVSQRTSTIANYIRAGGKVNLGDLRKMKYGWTGKRPKNYFDDLALEQFDIESFPRSMADVKSFRQKMMTYNQSVDEEIKYWNSRSPAGLTAAEQTYYRHYNRIVYSEIVDALLEDLHKEFHSNYLALPFEPSDIASMQQAGHTIENEIQLINKTVTAPAGSTFEQEEAYRRLRCEKIKAVYDKYMPKYNSIIEKRYKILKSRWKSYINQLIPILALDPTSGNRNMAYGTMAGYFSILRGISGSTMAPDYPIDCNTKMTLEEATALLQSKRNIDIECPEIFELEGEVFGVNVEVNCDGLKINAGMETEPIGVGYEKSFKSGMSTLWFGIGMEGALEFEGKQLGEGKMGNQFFISFDKHNQFADAGYRGQASFEGKGDNSIDFNYSFAINAGFSGSMETSGLFEGVESWFE